MRILIVKFLQLIPLSIGLFPYRLANFFVLKVCSSSSLEIWPRNSFIFKNIIPGLSDIDYTFFSHDISFDEVDKALFRYHFLKYIFPFLGEVNIYQNRHIDLISASINPYELNRDPRLKEKITSNKYNSTYLFIYLLRCFDSDHKNLISIPYLRSKKWFFHFKECNIVLNNKDINAETVINYISQKLLELTNENFVEILYDNYYGRFDKIEENYHRKVNIEEFMALFPIKWMGPSFANNNYQRDCILLFKRESIFLDLFLYNLEWELGGLLSQVKNISNNSRLRSHVSQISLLLGMINRYKPGKCTSILKISKYLLLV